MSAVRRLALTLLLKSALSVWARGPEPRTRKAIATPRLGHSGAPRGPHRASDLTPKLPRARTWLLGWAGGATGARKDVRYGFPVHEELDTEELHAPARAKLQRRSRTACHASHPPTRAATTLMPR
jgi:hypothetical protein